MLRTKLIAAFLVVAPMCMHAMDIHRAARAGDVEAVRNCLVIDSSSLNKPDAGGNTPLHLAALHKQTAVLSLLLNYLGIEIDKKNHAITRPIFFAAIEPCIELENTNSASEAPFFFNAAYNALPSLRLFLLYGACFWAKDNKEVPVSIFPSAYRAYYETRPHVVYFNKVQLAFLMGMHKKTGAKSAIAMLNRCDGNYVIRRILSHLRPIDFVATQREQLKQHFDFYNDYFNFLRENNVI